MRGGVFPVLCVVLVGCACPEKVAFHEGWDDCGGGLCGWELTSGGLTSTIHPGERGLEVLQGPALMPDVPSTVFPLIAGRTASVSAVTSCTSGIGVTFVFLDPNEGVIQVGVTLSPEDEPDPELPPLPFVRVSGSLNSPDESVAASLESISINSGGCVVDEFAVTISEGSCR